jgi:hypothetical protein
MVEEVLHVYNSLRVQLTIKVGFSSAIDQKPTTGLQYKMRDWLFSLLSYFSTENTFSLSVAAAVANVLLRIHFQWHQVGHERIMKLLELLRIYSESQNMLCPSYMLLCDLIPQEKRREFSIAIQSLCVFATKHSVSQKSTAWFAVLPLLHLLNGMIKPFDPIQQNPQNIKWNDGIVHLFGPTHAGYGRVYLYCYVLTASF